MCAGALALAALAGAAPAARAADPAPPAFGAPRILTMGYTTQWIGTGDFNGDGRRDLATVTQYFFSGSSRITVRLAQSGGGFGGPQTTQLTDGAYAPFVADLNKDGKEDVVVGNDRAATVTVLVSNGGGGFASSTFGTASSPTAVAAADFNRDGNADIVVGNGASTGTAAITLYTGNGAGAFTKSADFNNIGTVTGLAVGDLNSDGNPDLVAGVDDSRAGYVSVLLDRTGAPGAPFPSHDEYPAGGRSPSFPVVKDLNRDGKPDVAALTGAGISVLHGQDTGFFTTLGTQSSYPAAGFGFAVSDLNGDGIPDFATDASDGFGVLLGRADGTYTAETVQHVDGYPGATTADDVDGDGRPDVIVAMFSEDGTYLNLFSNATRTAVAAVDAATHSRTIPVRYSVPAFASKVASVDLYAKGPADAAFAKFATVAAGTGQSLYQATEGDGEYAFYAVGKRADGSAFDAPGGADAATQLSTFSTLTAEAPDFGGTDVGSSRQLPVVITNTGGENLRVSNPALAGANAGDFAIAADHCTGVAVAPGNQCTIAIRFTPGDLGARAATVSFTANTTPDATHTVTLAGTGTAPPTTLSAAAPDFGRQVAGTTGDPQHVTIANTGSAPLHVTGLAVGGANAGDFAVAADGCSGAAVAPGSACSVDVRFTPGDLGARAATLSFTANTTPSAANSVALAGTGVRAPTTLAADAPAFGGVTVGAPGASLNVAVTNTGGAPLVVTGAAIGGANAGDFVITADRCSGIAVAPGNQCTISVRFTPGAAGARSATLSLAANVAGDGAALALAGTGTVVQAVKPQRIAASLAFNYNAGRKRTTLHSLVVKGFPKGATVVAKLGKKTVRKRDAHGSVSLKDLIRKPLKAGTKITVTVSKTGMVTVTKTLTIRARKAPKVTTRY